MMGKCSFTALYIFSSLLFRDDHYDTSFVVPDEEYVCFHCLETWGGVGHCWQLRLMRNSKEVYFAITSLLEGTWYTIYPTVFNVYEFCALYLSGSSIYICYQH